MASAFGSQPTLLLLFLLAAIIGCSSGTAVNKGDDGDNLNPDTIVGFWESAAFGDVPSFSLSVAPEKVVLRDLDGPQDLSWKGSGIWVDDLFITDFERNEINRTNPILVISGFSFGGSKVAFGMLYIRIDGSVIRATPVTFTDDPKGVFKFHDGNKSEKERQEEGRN